MSVFTSYKQFEEAGIDISKYDAVIVGAGLAGTVIAQQLAEHGKKSLIIESREHVGGNCYTEKCHDIDIHKYGSHIFHTNSEHAWNWINRFTDMNDYKHKVMAATGDETVVLPFSMVTFMQIFNVQTVEEAQARINLEVAQWMSTNHGCAEEFVPTNFEEQAICLVGTTIYEKLIKHYTEKQWGRPATELPAEIIKRLPLRWNCDTTYFNNAKWQGIPVKGYTSLFDSVFRLHQHEIDVVLNCDWEVAKHDFTELINSHATKFVWTGALDQLFNYVIGHLEYRSLKFEHSERFIENFQGTAVVNFTDSEKSTPYTRITEHKWYSTNKDVINSPHTVVTFETSVDHIPGETVPYYPIGNEANVKLHESYVNIFKTNYKNGFLCGRLADYKYYDMDVTIDKALSVASSIIDIDIMKRVAENDELAS